MEGCRAPDTRAAKRWHFAVPRSLPVNDLVAEPPRPVHVVVPEQGSEVGVQRERHEDGEVVLPQTLQTGTQALEGGPRRRIAFGGVEAARKQLVSCRRV